MSIASLLITGCLSAQTTREWAETGIGTGVAGLQDLDQAEGRTVPELRLSANGHRVYPSFVRRDCTVLFEIDKDDVIVGYRLEGKRCY